MQSQAITLDKDAYMARVAGAIEQNFVVLISARHRDALWYRTPIDEKIAATESAARLTLRSGLQFFASARRYQARGMHDRASEIFRYARNHHETARQLLRDVKRLVAQRDGLTSAAAE